MRPHPTRSGLPLPEHLRGVGVGDEHGARGHEPRLAIDLGKKLSRISARDRFCFTRFVSKLLKCFAEIVGKKFYEALVTSF